MSERRYASQIGRLVSGKEVGRRALLDMPEYRLWLRSQTFEERLSLMKRGSNGEPPNPERIRVGTLVDGEGYGPAKVTKISVDGPMVRVWIRYGNNFEYGALLYSNKYPRRIKR